MSEDNLFNFFMGLFSKTDLSGRIASLASAHELLLKDEIEGAAIGEIVERVLAPFMDSNGRRFSAVGPTIRLTPEVTLALSMALHDPATNAIKYGALSVPEGQVSITPGPKRQCIGTPAYVLLGRAGWSYRCYANPCWIWYAKD